MSGQAPKKKKKDPAALQRRVWLIVAIAIAIKLTSRGSVIFKQRRYGLDGREIIVYKFRSMTVSEDADHVRQATRNDSRVTKVGAFLRKYSLDELPAAFEAMEAGAIAGRGVIMFNR